MNNTANKRTGHRSSNAAPREKMAGRGPFHPVLCILLGLGLGAAIGMVIDRLDGAPEREEISTGGVFHCRPGPWGDLECTRIITELPDGFIPADWSPQPVRWFFKHCSRQQVGDMFRSAGLTAAQRSALEATPWEESADGVVVIPGSDLVLELDPEARATIYKVLGAHPENPRQFKPFRYPEASATEWFADSGLRPETEALVRRLLFRRGKSLAFSDVDVVIPFLSDAGEQSRLLKTLTRRSTLLVKLHVEPGADPTALADYWSEGDRSKDIYPLLVSLARQPYGADIGLVHLLPPVPRELLYTYPRPDGLSRESDRDSHWTSLNFLRSTPDDRFIGDEEAVRQALGEDYDVVGEASRLGDVIVFLSAEGALIHSCAYVADNIVFTKNGQGWGAAWILMNHEDVLAFYSSVAPVTEKVYRLKPKAVPPQPQ